MEAVIVHKSLTLPKANELGYVSCDSMSGHYLCCHYIKTTFFSMIEKFQTESNRRVSEESLVSQACDKQRGGRHRLSHADTGVFTPTAQDCDVTPTAVGKG